MASDAGFGTPGMTLLLNTLSSESDGTDGASENSAFCELDGWLCSLGETASSGGWGRGTPPRPWDLSTPSPIPGCWPGLPLPPQRSRCAIRNFNKFPSTLRRFPSERGWRYALHLSSPVWLLSLEMWPV